jgi:hypothetical protein
MKIKVEMTNEGNVSVRVPIIFRDRSRRKIVFIESQAEIEAQDALVVAVARALRWQAAIDAGKFTNATELAQTLGCDKGVAARTMRLALLSPEIIHRIIAGNIPKSLTIRKLREALPMRWDEQKRKLLNGK